ncbi:MAG: four helix bundle protein [Planctomycetota bacterium]
MEKTGFDAYDLAVEITNEIVPIVKTIRPHDKDLAEELRTATRSIKNNLREGRRRAGGDRLYHFRISHGSADEVRASLDDAEIWGYVQPERLEKVRELLDREVAMLWSLSGY